MTGSNTGVGVFSRKWKSLQPEISVARISCFTSGSFRPKLGLFILAGVLVGCCLLIIVPLVSSPSIIGSSQHSRMIKMDIEHKDSVQAVAEANIKFTKKLYNELTKNVRDNDNLIMSPFSVSAVVSMILAGAKGNTASQIRTGLELPNDEHLLTGYKEALATLVSNDNFTLDTANKLYIQEGFRLNDAFLSTTADKYHAEAASANFAASEEARAIINAFVEKKTNGRIKDLIQSGVLSALTRMVLINAIYFKGDWAKKFDPKHTSKHTFHRTDGSTVEADMMFQSGDFRAANVKEVDAMALEMPYKGDRLSMVILLPNNGLAVTESSLANFDLSSIRWGFPTKFEVHFPKFKIESSHDLNDPLKNLGLVDMFDEIRADFSGMSEGTKLWVSAVVQKAFIEVNEEGSEAAAATAGIMMMRAAMITPKFNCDRPFVYFIRDNLTGLVLFAGRVADPNK